MISKIKSKSFRDVFKVLSGNIIAQGLGFLSILVIARSVDPATFGLYSSITALFLLFVQVFDFGMTNTYVKYVTERIETIAKNETFMTFLSLKIFLTLVCITVLFFFADSISLFLFHSSDYTLIMELMLLALIFHSIFSLILAHVQATQQFDTYARLNISHGATKFISVVLIALSVPLPKQLLFYCLSFFYSVILITTFFLMAAKSRLFTLHIDFQHVKKAYKFGALMFISSLVSIVVMRLDILMLQKLTTTAQVGYYAAAMQIAIVFTLLTSSLVTAILPKSYEYLQNHSIGAYRKNLFSYTKYVLGLFVIAQIFSLSFPFIYGEEYMQGQVLLQILLIGSIAGLLFNPLAVIFYMQNKIKVLIGIQIVQMLLIAICNYYLIQSYDAIGAAVVSSFVKCFGYASFFYWVMLMERRSDTKKS